MGAKPTEPEPPKEATEVVLRFWHPSDATINGRELRRWVEKTIANGDFDYDTGFPFAFEQQPPEVVGIGHFVDLP